MKTSTNYEWTCPDCGEAILVPAEVVSGKGPTLRLIIKDTAIADVAAHVWTHAECA